AYNGLKSYQPYYAEFIVAGVDATGPHVFISDMSGAVSSEEYVSTGSGSPIAYGVLESNYKKELTMDDAKTIATSAVKAAMERDPGSGNGIDVLSIPATIQVMAN
ncbi:MAG: proteasome subunit beta, partial [Nitrososphaerota archaeon]|nr:proteasome subunit beta [Nitrososphaerota archaeon]